MRSLRQAEPSNLLTFSFPDAGIANSLSCSSLRKLFSIYFILLAVGPVIGAWGPTYSVRASIAVLEIYLRSTTSQLPIVWAAGRLQTL